MPRPAVAPPMVIDLSCGHDAGHDAFGEAGVSEVGVGGHAAGVDEPGGRIDAQHLVEGAHVETLRRGAIAATEKIRRVLLQPHLALRGLNGGAQRPLLVFKARHVTVSVRLPDCGPSSCADSACQGDRLRHINPVDGVCSRR